MRAFFKLVAAPFILITLYALNGAIALTLMIGGIWVGAQAAIHLYGEAPTGADFSGAFPFMGFGVGMFLAIGVCGYYMIGFFIPFALDYLLGTAEDVAPRYKKVGKRVEGYIDQAQKYLDER